LYNNYADASILKLFKINVENTMKSIHIFIFLISFLHLLNLSSCCIYKTVRKTEISGTFSISGNWKCSDDKKNDIVSGVCTCKKDSLFYTSADNGMLENLSPTVDFYIGFKSIHFEKFFDQIYFDKKLRYAYRDSVFVTDIFEPNDSISAVYPCKNCNAMIQFKFLSSTYIMPYTFTDKMNERINNYHFYEKKSENFFHSTFISKNNQGKSGCQITNNKFFNTTHIYIQSNSPTEKIRAILSGINPI
jgi:hypothetical protein